MICKHILEVTFIIEPERVCVCVCSIWFYGISTIIGYLMPNQVYSYILDIYDL